MLISQISIVSRKWVTNDIFSNLVTKNFLPNIYVYFLLFYISDNFKSDNKPKGKTIEIQSEVSSIHMQFKLRKIYSAK